MTPQDLFKSGALAKAIEAQIQVVKTQPADQGKRLFLFELFAFAGELDRAQKQIDAIQADDPQVVLAVADYRKLLDIERLRRLVFEQDGAPSFFEPAPEHVALRLRALPLLRAGQTAEAGAILEEANAKAPALAGKCNDKDFAELRDADDRFGTVLEVMEKKSYYWVPLEQVASLTLNPPRFPRDLLWTPAHLELKSGEEGSVYLPSVYPGSYQAKDPQVQLGRTTEWQGDPPAPVVGMGSKTFLVGEDGLTILEWRKLNLS